MVHQTIKRIEKMKQQKNPTVEKNTGIHYNRPSLCALVYMMLSEIL